MIKQIILIVTLSISACCSAQAMRGPNSVDETLSHFKKYLAHYKEHQKNPVWVDKFQHFLLDKIVESDEKVALIKAACEPFEKETYYQRCTTGSLGFYKTAVGLSNAIDYFQKNCLVDPTQGECALYQQMLTQNIGQLKFILQVH